MACGLPVICHSSGDYREYIEHGKTGFLFDTDAEALRIMLQLKNDPHGRRAVGAAARLAMEQRLSAAARREIVDFYAA
jgi:glycosyltransferase involved in cell wall biosynthesis